MLALAGRFEPRAALDAFVAHGVTTFCAPPTVWRMLIQETSSACKVALREINSSPASRSTPRSSNRSRRAWGLTLRDSYGQTETTMMVGNSPGQKVIPGSMGRPLPGYRIALLDADGLESDQGEIALPLTPRPVGLMRGYQRRNGRHRRRRRRLLPHRRRRLARRRGLHHLHRPGRRRVQIERLSPEPVRARERADRARGGHGGGGRARARSAAPHHAESLCRARAGLRADRETARLDLRPRRASACRPTSASAGSSSPSCRRRRPARSAGWSSAAREAELAEKGERSDGEFRIEDFSVE